MIKVGRLDFVSDKFVLHVAVLHRGVILHFLMVIGRGIFTRRCHSPRALVVPLLRHVTGITLRATNSVILDMHAGSSTTHISPLYRLSKGSDLFWYEMDNASGVNDPLLLNCWPPDDSVVPYWLNQYVTDGSICPHEYSDLLLEDVTRMIQIVYLTFIKWIIQVLEPLDHIKSHLVGPIASRCIRVSKVCC